MNKALKDINIDFIATGVKGQNPEAVFQEILAFLSDKVEFPANLALSRLMEKEHDEKCTIGKGVAVPHARVSSLKHPVTILARLEKPVHFDADDQVKVDLVCLVLSPQNASAYRLMQVSRVSRLLQNEKLCAALREAHDDDEMNNAIYNPDGWVLAA